MVKSHVRWAIVVACALAGIEVLLSAQAARSPADGPSQDALLAELRGLRAEINQAAGVSIRTQLLVARLQLQEQRIFTVGRQLLDGQNMLAAIRQEILQQQGLVKQWEDVTDQRQRNGMRPLIAMNQAQIEEKQRREQELVAQESDLLNAVNSEQARWTELNDRLDALERSLPLDAVR